MRQRNVVLVDSFIKILDDHLLCWGCRAKLNSTWERWMRKYTECDENYEESCDKE